MENKTKIEILNTTIEGLLNKIDELKSNQTP